MPTLDDFQLRIQEAFRSADARVGQMREEANRNFEQLEVRYEKCDALRVKLRDEVVKPRLEALTTHFSNVEPKLAPGKHGGVLTLSFAKTPTAMARVTLTLSLKPDTGAKHLVAEYDLEILPVFVEYERHSHFNIDIEQPDVDGFAAWFDDRLVAFTKTYLSLQFVDQYQHDQMVTDLVAETRFPKSFAAGTVEHAGATYYFVTEKTKAEFATNPAKYVS